MSARQIVAMTVAVLVLIGGAGAVGAAASPDAVTESDENATGDAPADQDEIETPEENASELQTDNAESVGPSDGVPGQAADRVNDIHERIDAFLNGAFDKLGVVLSESLGTGEAA